MDLAYVIELTWKKRKKRVVAERGLNVNINYSEGVMSHLGGNVL